MITDITSTLRILPGGIPGTGRATGIDIACKDGIGTLYPFLGSLTPSFPCTGDISCSFGRILV
jgi:hypothetical protein